MWTRGLVTLGCGQPVQLVLVAEFGHLFTGVAIDDISILPGSCDLGECYAEGFCHAAAQQGEEDRLTTLIIHRPLTVSFQV